MATIERPKTTTSPFDIKELTLTPEQRSKIEIQFEGFDKELEAETKDLMDASGLPFEGLNTVANKPSPEGQENMLGSHDPITKEMAVYSPPYEKMPTEGRKKVVVHELSHHSSPLDDRNEHLYGSPEALELARNNAIAIAMQSAKTKVFLNGYQAMLYEQLEAGKIKMPRFVAESDAIAKELRLTHPEKIEQVQEAQHIELARQESMGIDVPKPVDLITKVEGDKVKLSALDATMINLLRPKTGVNSYEDLEDHVRNFRNYRRGANVKKAA